VPEPDQINPFRADRYRDAEAELGGADGVEKTTYVVGEGTDPQREKRGNGPAAGLTSSVPSGLLALVVALVFLVMVVYLLGLWS